MEWIEVTGRTTEEAEEHALKMLGIEREDVEFVILEEPKSGILGFKKASARLRARVKPVETPARRRPRKNNKRPNAKQQKTNQSKPQSQSQPQGKQKNKMKANADDKPSDKKSMADKPLMSQKHQEEVLMEFLENLLGAWNLSAEMKFAWPREDICEVNINGAEELGVLIGHNAEVLHAVEKIARIALKKKAENTRYAQIRLDVNDFRLTRQHALEDFVRKLADEVKDLGTSKILEPMNNRDRKIVHDALSEISGISTVSEGENPKRRVKIIPDS